MDFKIDHGFGLEGGGDEGSGLLPTDAAWRAFAVAVGATVQAELPDGASVAEVINRRRNKVFSPAQFYDQLIELAASGGENPKRLSDLVRQIDQEVLADAIAAGKNISQRKWLLQTLADQITVASILPLVQAAANAYQQPLSPVMLTLLGKAERRAAGDAAQRGVYLDLIRGVFEAWSAGSVDTTGTGYESVFGKGADQQHAPRASSIAPDPERVIALSFETGAIGNAVWNALARLGRAERGTRQIMDMLKQAPDHSKAADMVAHQFANPSRLATLLREDSVDFAAIDVLLSHMQESAGPTLLDALIEAKTSAQRRALLDRIAALGSSICDLAVERLQSETRWYALRDLLIVVREANCDLRDVPLDNFTRHEDVRVRKEATRLLFKNPVERDRAVVVALRDPEVEMLKIGLKAARSSMPESAVPMLARRVTDPGFPADYRTSVLLLLARSHSVLALEVLFGFAVSGKTFLGKPALAPKSPEMLIALSGLARMWSHDRRVAELLERARKSADPEITNALDASQVRILEPEMDDADDE